MKTTTFDEWSETYRPKLKSNTGSVTAESSSTSTKMLLVYDHNVTEDVDIIAKTDPAQVWSLVSATDKIGLCILSGVVNIDLLGYLITDSQHHGVQLKIDIPIKHAFALDLAM